MTWRSFALFLIAGAAAAAPSEKPTEQVYRLEWRDLDRIIRGSRISLVLPSGIRLEGDVVTVESDELILNVRKTSDKHAYPKGHATVPRPEVTRFRVVQKRGYTWRAVGTAIGAGGGLVVAIPVGSYLHNEGGSAALSSVLLVGVPAGLGYLVGSSADSNVMEIAVEPERPSRVPSIAGGRSRGGAVLQLPRPWPPALGIYADPAPVSRLR